MTKTKPAPPLPAEHRERQRHHGEDEVLRWCRNIVADVAAREPEMKARSDAQLRALTGSFAERLADGQSLEDLLPEAFAAVREAAVRTIGERPFDVQVMGGAVLHLGMVAEMSTGEGKTLTATMPAYLNALSGTPVHVMTANGYLARRDSQWMAPIYRFLGLTTGLVLPREEQGLEDRRAAYHAGITYGTWQQFGYDYLYDNCAWEPDECVQRGHGLGIVDEADLEMIDQARQVLRVFADAKRPNPWHAEFAKITPRLHRAAEGAGDYEVDEKTWTVSLLEPGAKKIENWLGIDNLYDLANIRLAEWLSSALAAKELYHAGRDYLVTDGKLVAIDRLTGRPDHDRVFENGVQQAIEAKEGLRISRERVTLAEIQEHDYLRLYQRLAAMAGVAASESDAYRGVYGLDVVTIPANRPAIRLDHLDAVHSDTQAKLNAIADEAQARHTTGQPVLIGTISVAQSEAISALLAERGIAHKVLNARNHQREAEILAEAGRPGAVTVVTQMAGRGVDIRLGGADGAARDKAADLGGLCVLGAERHCLRRLDLHLRGRAGRRGDPGESKFFLSLDDDLLARIVSPKRAARLRRLIKDHAAENKMTSWAIGSAQDDLQASATTSLLQALEYDAVLASQQRVIYADRRIVLFQDGLQDHVRHMIDKVIRQYVTATQSPDETRLWRALRELYPVSITPNKLAADRGCAPDDLSREFVIERVCADAQAAYGRREAELGADFMRTLEAKVILSVTDRQWREHLQHMHGLREGIHLRSLGGRSPLADYRREADQAFTELRHAIQEHSVGNLFNLKVEQCGLSSPKWRRRQCTVSVESAGVALSAGGYARLAEKLPDGLPDQRDAVGQRACGYLGEPEPSREQKARSAWASGRV